MDDNIMYNYAYGDENVIGSHIIIYNLYNNRYKIHFVQEALDQSLFRQMTTKYTVIDKIDNIEDKYYGIGDDDYVIVKTVIMIIKALNNPPPETLLLIS